MASELERKKNIAWLYLLHKMICHAMQKESCLEFPDDLMADYCL